MPGQKKTARLWTCPKCGAKLLTKNLWHSCGRATLADWKHRMGPRARALYDKFERMIRACGEYHVAPAQTRIAFLGLVRFAGITGLSEKGMTCTFALPYALRSERFDKIYEIVPGWWLHRLRVADPGQLDRELQAWLRDSYLLMGMRERLGTKVKRGSAARGNQASELYGRLADELGSRDGVTVGGGSKKGFGSGALKVNGKIFAMVSSKGRFVVKLPAGRVAALVAKGSGQPFDPGHGRLMKEWMEVDGTHLPAWRALALEALTFVRK